MESIKDNVRLETYEHGFSIYHESNLLRSRILLESLGRDEPASDYDFPDIDTYLGAFLGERLIGTVILTPLDEEKARMRQLVVDENFRDKGIARILVEKSEELARNKGFKQMILHARESAKEFYLHLGYEIASERFFEIEIPHYIMQKNL